MSQQKKFDPQDKLVIDKTYGEFPSALPQISCEEAVEFYRHYSQNLASPYQRLALGFHLVADDEEHSENCPYHTPGLVEEIRASLNPN